MRLGAALFLVGISVNLVIANEARKGYVLKAGEGELAAGAVIKASPSNGTQGGVMMVEPFPEHFSTGLHYHLEADEFFYVVSGSGTATLGGVDYTVGAGDVIFIPSGQDHKLFTNGS